MPPALRAFAGARVLVTGTTGFKGSWLALWLSELGAEVTGLALPPEGPDSHYAALGLDRVIRQHMVDLRDAEGVATVVRAARPQFVFHLAAQALVRRSYQDPVATFATNLLGTVHVMQALRGQPDLKAAVLITSDKCYRNVEWVWGYRETDALGGKDPYSASKAAAEMAIEAYRASWFSAPGAPGLASARAGNVIGGGDWSADRIVPDVMRALAAGRPVELRNPGATRPWQHVLEPLHGYLRLALALAADPRGFAEAWNFGPGEGSVWSVERLARALLAAWGGGEIAIPPADLAAPHEARLLQLSVAKAGERLGWHPLFDFETAAAETARWYRAAADGVPVPELSRAQLAGYMARLEAR
jgi:CDP-glucose 4,6-dehydratase